jgi:nitrate reductase gamma subunit
MRGLYSLFLLFLLIGLALVGILILEWHYFFGVILPYFAAAVFIIGFVFKIFRWARSPVPFRIPTTCGQQKSLSGIKTNNLENPHNIWGVWGRMILEVLFFRSLFRNSKTEITGERAVYGSSKWLWLAGLVFHWTFLIIVLRHFRFFVEPIPGFVSAIQRIDGIMQVGVPVLFMSSLAFLGALLFLLLRRIINPQVRYISMAADYFPLFLIITIGLTGVMMRYFPGFRVDIVAVKEMVLGLLSFDPVVSERVGSMFYIHLFSVSLLLLYFPFSKLVHMGGVFLSPTRNLVNSNRIKRHINPWNYPVKVHTYEEWEDEFRELMREANMPLEKE